MKKIIVFLFPLFSIAQSTIGNVIDKKSNIPIEDVKIKINRLDTNTTTDTDGKFEIKNFSKLKETDTLFFSHISYVPKKASFKEFKANKFSIFLEEKTELLDDVIIPLQTTKQLKSKIAYTKLTSLKYALSNFGSVVKDNTIYVAGGDASSKTDAWKKLQYEKVDPTMVDYIRELNFQHSSEMYNGNLMQYNIHTNQWETSKLKLRKRAYHNANEYDNKIYVLGGKRISANGVYEYLENTIEVIDLNKQTITVDNTNPHQATEFASFTYNNNLVVVGGSVKMDGNGKKEYSNKMHLYAINSGYWYELEAMPVAKETTGVLTKNKIYLFGGFNGKPLSTVESFDLLTEKWTTEGNLFTTLSHPAITSNEDMVYLFENEKIYTYNTNSKELKEYLINLPMKSATLFFIEGKLYLLGGYIENYYSKYPSPSLFSIDCNEFKTTQPNRTTFL
ncbi:MAG: hypothetical protein RL542_1092 [Bacteroidota bacterium]